MYRLARTLIVAAAVAAAATPARGGEAPSWTLRLQVVRWVAPSSFAVSVTGQTAGLRVRRGLPVTLRLDRRTRCAARDVNGAVTTFRCGELRPRVEESGPVRAIATGQFETGHLGAIGFRARTVTLV